MIPFSWPASFVAVAAFTLFAVVILCLARQLTARAATLTALGVLGAVLAALPALARPSPETPAVLGVAALAVLALLLLPGLELHFDEQLPEVAALLLLGAAGGAVLATADNLVSLAIGLETLSLSVAVMAALGRGERPLEAGFKYFVLAAVSLSALIYGIGLYALATGSLRLGAGLPSDPTLQFAYVAGLVLVALGFAFELAAAPLHWGALGVYVAAPPGLAGFVMSVGKLGAVLALSKLALAAGAPVNAVLIAIGILSIAWGTVGALAQRDLRGLLGYSAIAHAGFLALSLGSGPDGQVAAVFYVVVYAATAMLAFATLAGQGTGPLPLDSLSDGESAGQPDLLKNAGLGPLRAIALALALLSLAGIPPTPGFWAKLAILEAAWTGAGPIPTLIAVIGSVAGALYYLRPLPDLLAQVRAGLGLIGLRSPGLAGAAVALAGAVVVLLGLVPGLAYLLASLSQARA